MISVCHDNTPLSDIPECKALLLTGPDSVASYWRENTDNWFEFPAFDFFGPYQIMLPPPPDRRGTILNQARAAAGAAGVNLAGYDGFIVMNFPGQVNGVGYDHGSNGSGPGHAAMIGGSDTHTFYCHELGHVLGFDHSYGFPNTGADWTNDGIDQLYPVYGDPYDLMSSAAFGGATPTVTLPGGFAGFPVASDAGPMLARAQLHFYRPMAMESTGKVSHIHEEGDDALFTLYPAGHGEDGACELVAFHPANEDAGARGRIYVEYRQPFDILPGTRWDKGLAADGNERDRRGVIVHVVKDIPDSTTTAVCYAGRICFPSPDVDVEVDTPQGKAVVTVSDQFMNEQAPAHIRVRVTRGTRKRVSIAEKSNERTKVISSEKRQIPGWSFAGEFTWVRRETVRTVTYTPVVAGLGAEGTPDASPNVRVYWYVGNTMLVPDAGVHTMQLPDRPNPVHLNFSVDPVTRVLTLHNQPADGSFAVQVQASASDPPTWFTPITAESRYEVNGLSEGWGDDYVAFMDFMDRLNNPIPRVRVGPPEPEDYRIALERLRRSYDELIVASPSVAERMHPVLIDQERVFQRYSRHR